MPADQNRKSDSQTAHSLSVPASQAQNAPGGILCPVCHHLIPSEQIGRKPHCRRCGYLES
jgi:uncharacterized CHY-type Zn-finger protein